MKTQETKKAVRESNNDIISVGYCNMQFLLNYQNPHNYNAGVYGWDCDNYYFYNYDLVISTGYRPIKGDLKIDNKVVSEYEEKARNIINNNDLDYNKKELSVNALLHELIKKAVL